MQSKNPAKFFSREFRSLRRQSAFFPNVHNIALFDCREYYNPKKVPCQERAAQKY
jgi:hypothetical protein